MENITPPMAAKTASSALGVTGARGDARLAVDLKKAEVPAWWAELRFQKYANGTCDAYSPDGWHYLHYGGKWRRGLYPASEAETGAFESADRRLDALLTADHWDTHITADQPNIEPNPYATPAPVEPELNDGMPPAAGKCECGDTVHSRGLCIDCLSDKRRDSGFTDRERLDG